MRRQFMSQGIEHDVFRPRLGESNEVLKVSRLFNYVSMVGQDRVLVLRQELADSQRLLQGTDIKIPRTLIYRFSKKLFGTFAVNGYVIRQEYVDDDGSVVDVQKRLASQGLTSLVEEYRHEPGNFVASKGILYWVDPTKGTVGRFLESLGVMNLETYRIIRRKSSKLIRFFGL